MRKKIVAGNWKMNLDKLDSENLVSEIIEISEERHNTCIILAPPYIYLQQTINDCIDRNDVLIAAQNCSSFENGAYTGEVSAKMLKSIGVD